MCIPDGPHGVSTVVSKREAFVAQVIAQYVAEVAHLPVLTAVGAAEEVVAARCFDTTWPDAIGTVLLVGVLSPALFAAGAWFSYGHGDGRDQILSDHQIDVLEVTTRCVAAILAFGLQLRDAPAAGGLGLVAALLITGLLRLGRV